MYINHYLVGNKCTCFTNLEYVEHVVVEFSDASQICVLCVCFLETKKFIGGSISLLYVLLISKEHVVVGLTKLVRKQGKHTTWDRMFLTIKYIKYLCVYVRNKY